MKVIEINATYGIGSTGVIVKDIGDLLKHNGYEIRYAYQQGDCPSSEGYRIGSPVDWKLHALYTRLFGMQAWGSHNATKKLLSYLDQEKPDVVHLHNLHANYINLPLLLEYLARKDIATVVTLHDCWFFTGKCCHFVSCGCELWKTGCGHCPKKNETPKSVFFDRSAKVAREKTKLFHNIPNLTIVGCSKWISKLAKGSFVFRNCRIEQIYNGVDTDVFAPKNRDDCKAKLGITAKFVILGMANKWFDDKNKDVFQTVVSKLSKDEALVLVGCTDTQQKLVQELENVIAVGFISDRSLLADYYNSADVFVNLTFEDTLPTVNMEAISCGTPVITYDSCGSAELIQNNQTGYIIRQGNIVELEKSIEKIKNNEIKRETCREYAIKNFEKRDCYNKYISLFCDITNKSVRNL